MNNVIILGDVHLGKSMSIGKLNVGNSLNSRLEDQLNLLDWVLERAIEHTAGHIIVTGDVFEEPKPPPHLITLFISWLKKCQAHNVHCHVIIGNHDVLRSGFFYSSPLDIISEVELENVTIYKNIDTVVIGTTAFTMLPFRDRKSFSAATNAEALSILKESLTYELGVIPITYKKILVGHLAIEGSIPIGDEIDDVTNELFCPVDMFNGYDSVWMGHVHKPQVLKKKSPYIAHIGSMDISNFGETDHKKHIVIIDCDESSNNFLTEYIPTRSLKKIIVVVPKGTEDTTKFVMDYLGEVKDLEKSIVRVDITLSDPDLKSINKSLIDKELNKIGVFNVAGISESKKTVVVKNSSSQNLDSKMDVLTAAKIYAENNVDAKVRPDFIDAITHLYNEFKLENKE